MPVQGISMPAFLKRFYLLIFREKGGEGEREREKDQWVRETLIGCLSPGSSNLGPGCNPSMCPHQELNQQSFALGMTSNQQSHTGQGCQYFYTDLLLVLFFNNHSLFYN